MIRNAETPDAWFDALPPLVGDELRALRAVILATIPLVRETLWYGMPTYASARGIVCALNVQRRYLAFYLMDEQVLLDHERELAGFDCGKTCVRFRKPGELSAQLAQRLLRAALARQRAVPVAAADEAEPSAAAPEPEVEPKRRAKRAPKRASKRAPKAREQRRGAKKAARKPEKRAPGARKKAPRASAKKKSARRAAAPAAPSPKKAGRKKVARRGNPLRAKRGRKSRR
jgi:uncharacterized protein YdhG (YjbR/CyaY superfamily)